MYLKQQKYQVTWLAFRKLATLPRIKLLSIMEIGFEKVWRKVDGFQKDILIATFSFTSSTTMIEIPKRENYRVYVENFFLFSFISFQLKQNGYDTLIRLAISYDYTNFTSYCHGNMTIMTTWTLWRIEYCIIMTIPAIRHSWQRYTYGNMTIYAKCFRPRDHNEGTIHGRVSKLCNITLGERA